MTWTPPPDALLKRADRNREVLARSRPALAAALESRAAQVEIIIHDGALIGLKLDGRVFLPPEGGLELVERQRQSLSGAFGSGKRCSVVAGLGAGHCLNALNEALNEYSSAAAFAIEPDLSAWQAALFSVEDPGLWETPRLHLFAGDDAQGQAVECIRSEYIYLLPFAEFAWQLGALPLDAQTADRYSTLAREVAAAVQTLSSQFEPKLNAFLEHTRSAASSAASIWGCTHRDSYIHYPLLQAFLEGLRQAGAEATLSLYDKGFSAPFRVMGELIESRPDMIMSINAFPQALLEDLGLSANAAAAMAIPRVCWLVDDTKLYEDEEPGDALGEHDWAFAIDRGYLPWLKRLTPNAVFLPPGGMFHEKGSPQERFRAPVSYIGSLPDMHGALSRLKPAARDALMAVEAARLERPERLFHQMLDDLAISPDAGRELLDEARRFCSTTRKGFTRDRAMMEYFLYNAATFIKRKRIVEALLPLGLRVFGPESWQAALPDGYQDRYGGFVAPQDLADAYASTELTLNIHSHQCPTCLNPRDFDAPAAGGAVIGDWVDDMELGLFELEREALAFRSLDEAAERIRSTLADRDGLQTMREAAYQRVQSEHTYAHRARSVLETVFG